MIGLVLLGTLVDVILIVGDKLDTAQKRFFSAKNPLFVEQDGSQIHQQTELVLEVLLEKQKNNRK